MKTITGTVTHINLSGGFWAIKGNDGQDYRPINMPASMKKEGKKVSVRVKEVEGGFSIFMWGKTVEIV